MAENSKIEWTHHTFNPWQGCIKVSDGCKNCYAESLSKRWGKDRWGPGAKRERTSAAYWKKPLSWNKKAAASGECHRVFCASLADVFEDNPAQPELNEWRQELFALIDATPNLDWLLLTKRPENIKRLWPFGWYDGDQFTWNNIWLGTSAENQTQLDKRAPELEFIPAKVRFLSCEPLLGQLDLSEHEDYINWVIVGGESGHGARPMKPEWATLIRDQCANANIPFLFKQWGAFNADGKRVGKTKAGRLLDGEIFDQFPK